MMTHEMKEAVREAEQTLRAADNVADSIAYLLKHRLRSGGVSCSALTALKKELANFNMHTGCWKD